MHIYLSTRMFLFTHLPNLQYPITLYTFFVVPILFWALARVYTVMLIKYV